MDTVSPPTKSKKQIKPQPQPTPSKYISLKSYRNPGFVGVALDVSLELVSDRLFERVQLFNATLLQDIHLQLQVFGYRRGNIVKLFQRRFPNVQNAEQSANRRFRSG